MSALRVGSFARINACEPCEKENHYGKPNCYECSMRDTSGMLVRITKDRGRESAGNYHRFTVVAVTPDFIDTGFVVAVDTKELIPVTPLELLARA